MPATLPDRISGPVSLHVFDSLGFILLGDAHFKVANQCSDCDLPDCADVGDVIEDFVDSAQKEGTQLDVHIELPYVSTDTRERVMDLIDSESKRIGKLGELFHRFKTYLYDEQTKRAGVLKNVRFHYSDIRLEVNMTALPEEMSRIMAADRDNGPSTIFKILMALLVDEDPADDMPYLKHKASLSWYSGRLMHKVTKQYLKFAKTAPASEVGAMHRYVEDRVHDICDVLSIQKDMFVQRGSHDQVLRYTVPFVIMNVSMMCRCLFYSNHSRPTKGSMTIVYAGGLHAESMVDFFINYLHQFPSACQKLRIAKNNDYERCVSSRERCKAQMAE